MTEPIPPNFLSRAVLTTGRLLHQPFEVPAEFTKSASMQGGAGHFIIGNVNATIGEAVGELKPRGPMKLLMRLFDSVDQAAVKSVDQARKATELFWAPASNGAHQIGHAVSNPFALAYAKRVGFELPAEPDAAQKLLAQITDPDPDSTRFPGAVWPVPPPPAEEPPAPAPGGPQPTPGDGTEPTPEPTPGDGTEPTPEPTPGDGTEPTPEPTPGDGTEPTPEPTPGDGTEPTPEPKPEPTPGEGTRPTPDQEAGSTRSLAPAGVVIASDTALDQAMVDPTGPQGAPSGAAVGVSTLVAADDAGPVPAVSGPIVAPPVVDEPMAPVRPIR